MHVIKTDNVNNAYRLGLAHLATNGTIEPSRNGEVLVAPTPVTTHYTRPWQRVLFSGMRDANPFFHLMESLWMLAGRNDLAFVQQFNSKFGQYSDDGKTVRGAYGHRWRAWFGYDQLYTIYEILKVEPTSRRAVLTMWDAGEEAYLGKLYGDEQHNYKGDLLANTVDKPCNTHIYFRVNDGRLDMTVCCRSNDIHWGAYGANAVHFSFLQEVMALSLGLMIGSLYQISNNYHIYTDVVPIHSFEDRIQDVSDSNAYRGGELVHVGVCDLPLTDWLAAVAEFVDEPTLGMENDSLFIRGTAYPVYMAFQERDPKWASCIIADDWRMACTGWLARRRRKGVK